jgi:hypothetical protein
MFATYPPIEIINPDAKSTGLILTAGFVLDFIEIT